MIAVKNPHKVRSPQSTAQPTRRASVREQRSSKTTSVTERDFFIRERTQHTRSPPDAKREFRLREGEPRFDPKVIVIRDLVCHCCPQRLE